MKITREQRAAWAEESATGPFNLWLNALVKADGVLNLDRLYEVARRYGIEQPSRYEHLNSGHQRMIIGSMLRKRVPEKIYAAASHSSCQARQPEKASRPDYIRHASVRDLLFMQAEVINELRDRQIVRTSNSPLGDYAELLFATAFGWDLQNNSSGAYDAVDAAGMRYQIKSRRITHWNASRQLSALRRLPEANFDTLAAVLFDESFSVMKAVLIPHAIVLAEAKHVEHTNSWRFLLHDRVWAAPGANDVTQEIDAAAAKI